MALGATVSMAHTHSSQLLPAAVPLGHNNTKPQHRHPSALLRDGGRSRACVCTTMAGGSCRLLIQSRLRGIDSSIADTTTRLITLPLTLRPPSRLSPLHLPIHSLSSLHLLTHCHSPFHSLPMCFSSLQSLLSLPPPNLLTFVSAPTLLTTHFSPTHPVIQYPSAPP